MGNTNTAYTFLVSGGFSILAYLVGGYDNLIMSLAIMMGVDFLSGIMVAAKKGLEQKKRIEATKMEEESRLGISSKKAFFGLMKKAAMILAVVVAVRLDMLMGNTGDFMRNALIMGFIGMEGISFFENLDKLGVQLPKQFTKTFAEITQEPVSTRKKNMTIEEDSMPVQAEDLTQQMEEGETK